jgi:hypothetical protein
MQRIFQALLLATLASYPVILSTSALAQEEIRVERVQFAPGSTSAVVNGSIVGYDTVDYVLNAKEGQYMNVSMTTDNTSNYFNILKPGENEKAIFNSSMGENQYEGVLPKSGDYKVRVYLMRSAARENEVANYSLEMSVTNPQSSNDALVQGTNYNATGDIPCTMTTSQPTGSCPFGVVREGNGGGMVTVTKPDGRTRTIFFENGTATGADTSEADPGEFKAQKQGDLNIIRIGEERYEIPDVVIFGG